MHRRVTFACTLICLLAGLILLAQARADAHNYYAFLFNYAGFAEDPEKLPAMPAASDTEVDRLLSQLKDTSVPTRMVAAGALGQTGSSRAVEPLIGAVSDQNQLVSAAAALSLGMLKDKRAIEPLNAIVGTVGEPESLAQMTAVVALEMLGVEIADPSARSGITVSELGLDEPTLRSIQAALKSGDRPTATRIMLGTFKTARFEDEDGKFSVLCDMVDASCLDVLLDALKTGTMPARCAAAYALGRLKDPRSVDALISTAADKTSKCRGFALMALADLGDARALDVALDAIKDTDWWIRMSAVRVLQGIPGDKASSALLAAMSDRDERVSGLASDALAGRKDAVVIDVLIGMLKSPRLMVARDAARMLGEAGDPKAVEPLIAALGRKDDANHGLRDAVVTALGQIGDPRAVQPIMSAHTADIIDITFRALAGIKHPSAARSMLKLLSQLNPGTTELQAEQVTDLMHMGSAAAEPALEALRDPSPVVRAIAAGLFSKVKDSRSVAPLVAALADKSAEVRSAAARGLGNQGDKQAAPKLRAVLKDLSADVRSEASLALGSLGDAQSLEALAALLADKNAEVRKSAGLALCKLGDARGVTQAVRLLTFSEDSEPASTDILLRAVRAFGELKDKRAIGSIIDLMTVYLAEINQSTFDGEPEKELITAPVEALTTISGQNFGPAYYRWMAWGIAEGYTKLPALKAMGESFGEAFQE